MVLILPRCGSSSDNGTNIAAQSKSTAAERANLGKTLLQVTELRGSKDIEERKQVLPYNSPVYQLMRTPLFDNSKEVWELIISYDVSTVRNRSISDIEVKDKYAEGLVKYNIGEVNYVERIAFTNADGTWRIIPDRILKAAPLKVTGGSMDTAGNIGETIEGDKLLVVDFRSKTTARFSFGWVQLPQFILTTEIRQRIAARATRYITELLIKLRIEKK